MNTQLTVPVTHTAEIGSLATALDPTLEAFSFPNREESTPVSTLAEEVFSISNAPALIELAALVAPTLLALAINPLEVGTLPAAVDTENVVTFTPGLDDYLLEEAA